MKITSYSTGIENKVIEEILTAKKSIVIAMAWLTNIDIIQALINISNRRGVIVQIVVDKNLTNEKYFEIHRPSLVLAGVDVLSTHSRKFLHHKFMVIDNKTTITGSYNFSKKANFNAENIVKINDQNIGSYYTRIFKSLTEKGYVDQNIKLLHGYSRFARKLISAYYNFRKSEVIKYQSKIIPGDCYTHENGFHDVLEYFPGIIFNKRWTYYKHLPQQEFELPITKDFILQWTKDRNQNFILESYGPYPDSYHEINGALQYDEREVEKFFKRKVENIYGVAKIEKLILEDINIILEDEFWQLNFEPFITRDIVADIFKNLDDFNPSNYYQP